jgi:hypothetical protein
MWHTPANPWFEQMTHNLGGAMVTLVGENWAWLEFGFLFFFALLLVPAIVRRVRWGPRGTEDENGQGRWNI